MYLSKAKSTTASPPLPLLSNFKFVLSEVQKVQNLPFQKLIGIYLSCSPLLNLQPWKKRVVGLSRKTVGAAACQGRERRKSELLGG